MGALGYNLKKMEHSNPQRRAELLETNFNSLSKNEIRNEVDLIRQLRPGLNRYVYHTSLNFSAEESHDLPNEKLLAIATDYLNAMGFDDNQYFIFRHYDAEHPHLHLLVNRIRFDSSVVSDSNNFKRSEKILRELEYRYNLIPVEQSKYVVKEQSNAITRVAGNAVTQFQSNGITVDKDDHVSGKLYNRATVGYNTAITVERNNYVSQRAPKKDEIEMAVRTKKASEKMFLQKVLSDILKNNKLSMQDFIQQCEAKNINLLFNQASTGRISGITYFHGAFKAKGQALGDRFKWMEIIKRLDYEQDRDSEAVGKANGRTRSKYGDFTQASAGDTGRTGDTIGNAQSVPGNRQNSGDSNLTSVKVRGAGEQIEPNRERSPERDQDADHMYRDTADTMYHDTSDLNIQIADDVDDEAIYGKERRRQQKARINRR